MSDSADAAESPEGPEGQPAPDPHAEAADGLGEESAPPMTPDELNAAYAAVCAERDSYLETAQRVQAEFDNFRKRSVSEVDNRVRNGLARMAESLLPVLDAFDAAIGQGDESVEPLRGQLSAVLEREGLERIGAAGEPFDPNLHEAVLHESGEGGEPTVAEELRPGYLWHGRVLRAAMVKVRG